MIGLEFDGVLHISVSKPTDDDKILPLKDIKYNFKKLTPNHKLIDLIKKYDDIMIITQRTTSKSINTIKSFLDLYDIKIKKKNIILAGNNKIDKIIKNNIIEFYDSNENLLNKINKKNKDIKLYLINPYNLTIDHINKQTKKIIKEYNYGDDDDDDDLFDDAKYSKKYINEDIVTPLTINYGTKFTNNYLQINVAYCFDGVLHNSVIRTTSFGEIKPIPIVKYSPHGLLPNYTIINQIKSNYNAGMNVYIITNRISSKSLNTIISFLNRNEIGLNFIPRNQIILNYEKKISLLTNLKLQIIYQSDPNKLNNIRIYNPNIKLYLVDPFKKSIKQYNSSIITTTYDFNIIKGLVFKNAAIILITGNNYDRIILVRDKFDKKWMIPGGIIARHDKSPYYGAAREVYEETSFPLPKSERTMERYNYNNHTIIYKIYCNLKKLGKFRVTSETDLMVYPKIKDVYNGIFESKYGLLKSYNKRSFNQMRLNGFL